MVQVIAQHYQILEELGQGGMGTVYRGLDTHTKLTVAVKQLKPELTTPELIERFVREGTALRELNHPNIVKMLDSVEEGGNHYLIIEYLAGGDLNNLLKSGQLPIEKVLQLAIDICDALTRAHRLDIIHRDLKPANVLLADDGTPRLTDFGIARIGKQERVTATDAIVGTVDYLAPEALDGSDIDARADIWAFGVMLFEMLTSKRPFSGESVTHTFYAIVTQPVPDLEALRPDAPVALIDLIYRMLEKSRDARIRSVRQVGLELEDILHGRTQQTPPETRFAPETPNLLIRPKHNLPAQTTPFVGRESELAELAKLLNDPKIRLVTILATGGMGKTRLALEVAEQYITPPQLLPDASRRGFNDGVYFVELAPLADSANIVSAIAEATGYQFQADGREPKQQILDFLANKNLLLVLDNFEHLLEGASLITDILKAAPQVKILATSRQRLNQSGETLFNLEGMDFPAWEMPANALEYAAVKLFLQSAKRAKPDFEITSDNMDGIARICKLVQGMPLGIVLAAAWLSMLTPEEIATEIEKGIDFLERELSDLPERHQSIRAVFDYSWDLLTDDEKQVFMKLSVFRGGFTREAAEAVAGANLRILMSLMNKSLIRRDADSGRYEIHELLRQYGIGQLELKDDSKTVRDKHSDYYLDFLIKREASIKGQGQIKSLQEIKTDFENVRIAWNRGVSNGKFYLLEQAIETLIHAAEMNRDLQEVLLLLEKTVNSMDFELNESLIAIWDSIYLRYVRVKGLITKEVDKEIVESILQNGRERGDEGQTAFALWVLGDSAALSQDYITYLTYYEEAITIFRNINDKYYLGHTLLGIYDAYLADNQPERMLQHLNESAEIRREIGDKHGLCFSLYTLGAVSTIISSVAQAEDFIDEALNLQKQLGTTSVFAHLNGLKSFISALKGNFEAAKTYAEIGMKFSESQNYLGEKSLSVMSKGFVESANGDYGQGIILFTEAKETAFLPILSIYAEWGLAFANCGLGNNAQAQKTLSFIFTNKHVPLLNILSLPIAAILLMRANHHFNAVKIIGFCINQPKSIFAWMDKWALLNHVRDQLKSEIGEETYYAELQKGKFLDLETVVQHLLAEFGEDA